MQLKAWVMIVQSFFCVHLGNAKNAPSPAPRIEQWLDAQAILFEEMHYPKVRSRKFAGAQFHFAIQHAASQFISEAMTTSPEAIALVYRNANVLREMLISGMIHCASNPMDQHKPLILVIRALGKYLLHADPTRFGKIFQNYHELFIHFLLWLDGVQVPNIDAISLGSYAEFILIHHAKRNPEAAQALRIALQTETGLKHADLWRIPTVYLKPKPLTWGSRLELKCREILRSLSIE